MKNCEKKTQKFGYHKALDKREYFVIIRDNLCQFCIKYVMTPPEEPHGVTTYGFNEK